MFFADIKLDEFKSIIDLFNEDAGKQVEANINMGRLFIRSTENELMLRCKHYSKELVIARIEFRNVRTGNGTTLLNLLKEYGKENGYTHVVIESVLTENMSRFATKNGFVKKDDLYGTLEDIEPFVGDYILNI